MKIFRKIAKLILCKWLKIHWIRESHTVYEDGTVEPDCDIYCRLCLYCPGIDNPDDYDYMSEEF